MLMTTHSLVKNLHLSALPLSPSSSHPLILLAEDNDANVLTITQYLEAQGYRIVVAQNGRMAVEMAKAQQPDLILMDVQMPEMDGLEATRQIRADAQMAHIPIIALTSFAMERDREQALASGVDGYMAKPIILKELVSAIGQHLSQQ